MIETAVEGMLQMENWMLFGIEWMKGRVLVLDVAHTVLARGGAAVVGVDAALGADAVATGKRFPG